MPRWNSQLSGESTVYTQEHQPPRRLSVQDQMVVLGCSFNPVIDSPLLAATLPGKKGQKPSAGQKRVSEALKNTPEESWGNLSSCSSGDASTQRSKESLKRNMEGVSEEFNSGRGWWWVRRGGVRCHEHPSLWISQPPLAFCLCSE